MNKDQKFLVIIIVVILLLTGSFGVYAVMHKDEKVCKTEETDAIKFKREYEEYNDRTYDNGKEYFTVSLSNKNLFKYITEEKVVKLLKEGTGVIYFGFPQCPWCRTLVPYLEEIAKDNGISEINYLNIQDLRDEYKVEDKKIVQDKKGSDSYYEILDILDEYLEDYVKEDEQGNKYKTGVKRLYAPTTVVVKEGKIVAFHTGTVETQKKFLALTDEEVTELKEKLDSMFILINNTICTDTGC